MKLQIMEKISKWEKCKVLALIMVAAHLMLLWSSMMLWMWYDAVCLIICKRMRLAEYRRVYCVLAR